MNQLETLLIEIGTEELPPTGLKTLSDAFTANIQNGIKAAGFSFELVTSFAAPRRLAVAISACQSVQADSTVEKRGPAVSVAFDEDGTPTRAAQGWAKSNGISVEQAQRLKTDKGEWLLHVANVTGKQLTDEIQSILDLALKKLPIAKPMRWGSSESEFIRPVHTLCVMLGDKVLSVEAFGLKSSNQLSGHRFHGQSRFTLKHADQYAAQLKDEYVLADYASRMSVIEASLLEHANKLGLKADYNQSLLEEISSLVEWPVVLTAKFEDSFLQVPKEALIYTMKDDQKYVPLVDADGELASTFLFVSNIESKDPSQVISGNEKVIRPRLSDAQFFFETDKKTTLESKANKLSSVLFQKELGTVAEKAQRLAKISEYIATAIGSSTEWATRAAYLCKADLMSNMVMEFPSVQGVMGKHYALHDKEHVEVANAIEEQYLPKFSGDRLPSSDTGVVLSLAEKLDTLVGIFGIGKLPKGDKDPFALRRSAIGLLRLLIERNIQLNISDLVSKTVDIYADKLSNKDTAQNVCTFLQERFKPLFVEQGIALDVIAAVMATGGDVASDIDARIKAVSEFKLLPAAQSLASANKRVSNILNKNADALAQANAVNEALFETSEEVALYKAYKDIKHKYEADLAQADYVSALSSLSVFEQPLNAFFENIMIMAEDIKIRNNRLKMLSEIRLLMSQSADISALSI